MIEDALAPTGVEVASESVLGVSSSESIRTTRAKLIENGKDLGWYVIKQFRGEDRVEEHLAAYNYLKENGFPVPVDVRRVFGRPDSLAATDLTNNGELELYSCNTASGEGGSIKREAIRNLEEVKKELIDIAAKAEKLGIIITNDSYFFVYNPDTMEGHVVIGDLGGAVMSKEVAQRDHGYGPEDTTFSLLKDSYYPNLVRVFNGGELFPDTDMKPVA